jgi:hypothetical protein
MDDQARAMGTITDALKALAIANQSFVNVRLNELGFSIAFNNQGETLYVISDYPNRPTHDFFKDAPIVNPVGYTRIFSTFKGNNSQSVYGLQTPSFIVPATSDVPDILPQLKALEDYANKYKGDQGKDYPLSLLIPYFFIFEEDFDSINLCLDNKVHPKRAAELLSLGYSLEEIIDSKDITTELLLKMGDTSRPLSPKFPKWLSQRLQVPSHPNDA